MKKNMKSTVSKELIAQLNVQKLFESKNSIVLVYVPQIQLSPYIAAVLRKFRNELKGDYLIIHPESNIMSRGLLQYSESCYGVHLKHFKNPSEDISSFINYLIYKGKKVSSVICHSFAEGINSAIINFFLKSSLSSPSWYFYSDGSRNNNQSEFNTEGKSLLINRVVDSHNGCTLIEFGFESSGTVREKSSENLNKIIVGYEWLDLSYDCTPFKPDFSDNIIANNRKKILSSSDIALVLSRYWGREPYFFDSEDNMYDAFVSSINIATEGVTSLIYRGDNRSNIETCIIKKKLINIQNMLNIYELEELVSFTNVRLNELLFELIISNDNDLFSRVSKYFSFDSSFPLIFISKTLLSLLPDNVEIYVGFDREKVNTHGSGVCYEVMKKRTLTVIQDVIKRNIFNVNDQFGPVLEMTMKTKDDISHLNERFEKSNGLFILSKKTNLIGIR
jgi:hypothetical protein